MSNYLAEIDGRGNNKVIEAQVDQMVKEVKDLTPELKPTTGPTLYEQEKAQEDEWE